MIPVQLKLKFASVLTPGSSKVSLKTLCKAIDFRALRLTRIVIVHKKTGEICLCIDFRALNAITIHDSFPLP